MQINRENMWLNVPVFLIVLILVEENAAFEIVTCDCTLDKTIKNLFETRLQEFSKKLDVLTELYTKGKDVEGPKFATSCKEAKAMTKESGVQLIKVDTFSPKPFLVHCIDFPEHGNDWTMIQSRLDGTVDFYRNWTDYQQGFGNLEHEFWIGLDKLHALTTSAVHELLIVMQDFDDVQKFAKYETFAIGDERESYALNVLGKQSGNAGDALKIHRGRKFSAKDMNSEFSPGKENCAVVYKGAWWYSKCHDSNLNGQYLRGKNSDTEKGKGIEWGTFHLHYSLKSVKIMIRPKW